MTVNLCFGKKGEIGIDKKFLLELLYPTKCPFCGEVRSYGESMACPDCLKELKVVAPPYCLTCGKTIDQEEEEYCQDCSTIPKSFRRGYPVYEYAGELPGALYDFKYHNQRGYAAFFAECIDRHRGKQLRALQLDGIVPVPVHRKKKKSRGYNQAELLGRELSGRLSVPIYPDYLIREVNTPPQKELNDILRMKNLKNAFKIGENTVQLRKILLVDDIYTSGATIEACTKVLLSAGAKAVYYTSIAIGRGYSG